MLVHYSVPAKINKERKGVLKTCVFSIVVTLNNKLYERFSFVFNIAFYV
jgi:hypothetical protein